MVARLTARFVSLLLRQAVLWMLLGALVSSLVASVDAANWVKDERALVVGLLAGIVVGAALASSRFRGWFVLFYALFSATVIAIQSVAHLTVPAGLFFRNPLQALDVLNLRFVEFSLRVGGWLTILQSGGDVKDTGLFVMVISFVLALCAMWLVWMIVRKREALLGLLPVGVLLAVNVNLSRQRLSGFVFFLFAALLLMVREAYQRQHADWQRRQVDYPEQLGLEWGGAALAMTVVILLVARLAPLAGTPEGWRILADLAARSRQTTENTATRLFSGVNPPPAPPADARYVAVVAPPDLGEIGAPISQGSETVMWVQISDPAPMLPDARMNVPPNLQPARMHYWRSGVYSNYTGRGWQSETLVPQQEQPLLPQTPPPGRYLLSQTYDIQARHADTLFAVNAPAQSVAGVLFQGLPSEPGVLLRGSLSHYQVVSAAVDVTVNQLIAAPPDYPAEIGARYLQLPATLPARVRILAKRLVEGQTESYDKALRIQNYLRENFSYSLNIPVSPAGQDAVDAFLFEQKAGFCSHYASAMVVMLRSVGVPARVATGYAMGDYDPQRGAFRVPESAAHAWVEVYFSSYGWVEFEPTVNRAPLTYPEESPSAHQTLLANRPPPLTATRSSSSAVVAVLALAAVLLALPILLLAWLRGPRRSVAIQPLYRQLRRSLAWAGLRAAPSVTPDEYLTLCAAPLQNYPRLSQALGAATALYRQTLYSSHPADARQLRVLSTLWQQSWQEWLTLWLRAWWARRKK